MAVGAVVEPLVVVSLLFGGAWFNRNQDDSLREGHAAWESIDGTVKRNDEFCHRGSSQKSLLSAEKDWTSPSSLSSLSSPVMRRRKIQLFGYKRVIASPNTLVFKHRFLSRVLQKFPFLVEACYWALIYWIYQLGRAFTAVTLVEGTVDAARRHALQIIHLEQRLHIFWEVPIQRWFLQHPTLMQWTNRVYSFIHIPGTIFFLVALYYATTTRQGRLMSGRGRAGPALYEARRRTMAMCNLLAFVIFTLWPCMPPRLLSDPEFEGDGAVEAKGFGFVDTVHSSDGEKSVWTSNQFCNQYAAMPSLHFGYSLLIGLSVATLPVSGVRSTVWKRMSIIGLGMSYPALILTTIVATANHFVLDAVVGAVVCGIAWNANDFLLNLCVVEDYFLWMVRIHKPVNYTDPETAVETQFHSKTWNQV